MRPGPNLHTLTSALTVGVRVSVSRGGEMLAVDVPAENVTVEETAERAVRGRLSFDVGGYEWEPDHPLAPLNNFGQMSHVVVVVESELGVHEVDLGWWAHEDWEVNDGRVRVTAFDLCRRLEEDDMVWPSSPPSGSTVWSELQRLAGGLPVVLDGVDNRPISRSFQWGTKRLEAIRELCTSCGLSYGMKSDGFLHVWELRTSAGLIDEIYTVEDLLLDSPRKSQPRRPNRWIVVASKDDTGDKWSAERTAYAEPYDPGSYGNVTERHDFNVAASPQAVEDAVDTYVRKTMVAPTARSIEMAYDPRIEIGDVIGARSPEGDQIVGRVIAYSARVDAPGELMRVDVEEMLW